MRGHGVCSSRLPGGWGKPSRPILLVLGMACAATSADLEVGPGKRFARIEEANLAARAGDRILVYPLANDVPYEATAVFVRQPGLVFQAAPAPGRAYVRVSGKGFRYSGVGSVPRAIFQFNAEADRCTLAGFDLSQARNDSSNGAGVRVNQANHVTIRDCLIHDNDMGVMSNGDGTLRAGVDQRIERCRIYGNGQPSDPGYNHNLYLGGTSVTLRFCEIHGSVTGHNVKSRAHHTRVEYCYVHGAANREFDLVDAAETACPESHAVLLGNVIVKDPQCRGNRTVIHFGQDGGREHDGTLWLVANTIVTPFVAPVVDLSAPKAGARLVGNLVSDGGQRQSQQKLLGTRNGARIEALRGEENWLSGDFRDGLNLSANRFRRFEGPMFVDPSAHDYRLSSSALPQARLRRPLEGIVDLPVTPGVEGKPEPLLAWQYRHPAAGERRPVARPAIVGALAR